MERRVAVIDLKSFYSSVECVCRHLDMFKTPLVCCDPYRSESSVVMSVTPYLKEVYGVPNVCRKRDLPKIKGMIFARPRMSYYLKMAAEVIRIFRKYVAEEDIHVYSVDESFLNLTPYLTLYQCSAEELVEKIKKDIYQTLGLIATAGIGDSLFLAKCALDQQGKKKAPYTATWTEKDSREKLWQIKKLTAIWGIANGTERHLKRIGVRTPKELGLADKNLLEEEFGVIGHQLHYLLNGHDESDIRSPYIPKEKSLHVGQTLIRDYKKEEAILLIKEMSDDLRKRLRQEDCLCRKIFLGIQFTHPYGFFGKEVTLPVATNGRNLLEKGFLSLYSLVPNYPIRQIYLAMNSLEKTKVIQGSLWANEQEEEKSLSLDYTLDSIQNLFGLNSVLRCSSLKKESTAKLRHEQIGGHRR